MKINAGRWSSHYFLLVFSLEVRGNDRGIGARLARVRDWRVSIISHGTIC
jgi:hypothetical protein